MRGGRVKAADEEFSGIHKTGQSGCLTANGGQGKGPILSSDQAETIVAVTKTVSLTAVARRRYKRLEKLVRVGGLRRWIPLLMTVGVRDEETREAVTREDVFSL